MLWDPHSFLSKLLLSWASRPCPHLSYLAVVPQSCPSSAMDTWSWSWLAGLTPWLDLNPALSLWSCLAIWTLSLSWLLSLDFVWSPHSDTTGLSPCWHSLCLPAASSCLASHCLFLMEQLDLAAPWQGDSWQQAWFVSYSLGIILCNDCLKKEKLFNRWRGPPCRIKNSHAKTLPIRDNFSFCNCARNEVAIFPCHSPSEMYSQWYSNITVWLIMKSSGMYSGLYEIRRTYK